MKNFVRIVYPLTSVKNLPPKEYMKRCRAKQEVVFQELEMVLCSASILTRPHFDKPFFGQTRQSIRCGSSFFTDWER